MFMYLFKIPMFSFQTEQAVPENEVGDFVDYQTDMVKTSKAIIRTVSRYGKFFLSCYHIFIMKKILLMKMFI